MLAIMMKLAGSANLSLVQTETGRVALVAVPATWINYTYLGQALLGALSVLLTIAIARQWLDYRVALGVGLLVALWPHSVTFRGVLLSETLFGFVLLLALWLSCLVQQRRSVLLAVAAGSVFAIAYLVNPVITAFPILVAGILAARKNLRLAILLMLVYSIGPAAWMARNSTLPEQSGSALLRAEQNFVQGSWPEFLAAYNARFSNDIAGGIIAAEAEEERAFNADPLAGLTIVWQRMAANPGYYLSWYLLHKPFLLWDWNIRIGWGDIYFLPVKNSPYDQLTLLKGLKNTIAFLNPFFFVLAVVGAILGFLRRDVAAGFAVELIALLVIYVTTVYTLLQAEPRYSIPFRPEELLLSGSAVAGLARWLMRFKNRRAASKAIPGV